MFPLIFRSLGAHQIYFMQHFARTLRDYRILAHTTRVLYDFLHKTVTTARYSRTRVIRIFIYTRKIS